MQQWDDDVMGEREIAEGVKKLPYFKVVADEPMSEQNDGTRDIGELYPFLICGGTSNESNYTEAFPKRIKEILSTNNDVKIFCVFDWDTIYGDEAKLKKHEVFEEQFKEEISNGTVTVCPSMPSIEYWFLLHFVDDTKLLKNYGKVASVLAPYLKPCFSNKTKSLKKLLKSEKYLKDVAWVESLCANGKLALAIERAEKNIKVAEAADKLKNQSYSYVYKVFKR